MSAKAQIRIRVYDVIYCSRRPKEIRTKIYLIEISEVECLASGWGAVRSSLARRRIKQSRLLVLGPRPLPVVWLVPSTLSHEAENGRMSRRMCALQRSGTS